MVKRFRIEDLGKSSESLHILGCILEGRRLYKGGVSFHLPGQVSHADERPHVESDQEAFVILQGQGWIEIEGIREAASAGDVFLIEPGEDHHLISSDSEPFVNLWLHARSDE